MAATPDSSPGVLYFDWYRDSRHMVFSSATNAAAEIRALDLDTGEQTVLLQDTLSTILHTGSSGDRTSF